MKNVLILYFSGTGNTLWASKRFAEHLNRRGFRADAVSIESDRKVIDANIASADIIFLNYPVYGSDKPEIIKDFIRDLPESITPEGKKPFGIICTQMMFSGDGAWLEHEIIEQKGYRLDWALHLNMPNNISIPGFPFRYTNNPDKLRANLENAENRLGLIADTVAADSPWRQGTSIFSKLLGLMQRAPYRRMLPKLRDDLSIDPFSCTRCGRCIELCPVENIFFAPEDIGGFPEFQGKCNLCLRCYNFCPTQAVMYRSKRFKPGKGTENVPYAGPSDDFDPAKLKKG